ncbi:MAG TPA: hypothetical protein PKG89_15825, partial [Ferruginibacter sp.]|nr:hypothetical protein [Ferruginibacter sp.]
MQFHPSNSRTGIAVSVNLFFLLFSVSILLSSCIKDEPGGGTGGGTGGGSPLTERIILDTAYGTAPAQKMDIYLPAGRTAATKLIILIHGGGWEAGDKADMNYYKNLL